jgi:hypothetical protein
MKYAIEMGLRAMIFMSTFIRTGLGIKSCYEEIHRHTDRKVIS